MRSLTRQLLSAIGAIALGWVTLRFGTSVLFALSVLGGGSLPFGLPLFVVSGIVKWLPKAEEVLAEERSRTVDERNAFERFAERVESIEPADGSVGGPDVPAGNRTLTRQRSGEPQLEQVQQAYRETIMDVPHYEAEYDESLAENMAVEFGEDVARAVLQGEAFTSQHKQALIASSATAREERTAWLELLDSERQSVETARATYTDAGPDLRRIASDSSAPREMPFDTLETVWEECQRLEDRCEALLQERQQQIHHRRRRWSQFSDSMSLYAYLYSALPVTHPVLADGGRVVSRIRAARSRIARALSRKR